MTSPAFLRCVRRFAFAVLLLAPLRAQIVTNLGNIEWGNPAGWSSGRVPTGTDTPQISSGTVNVAGSHSVTSLQLQGGTIGGGGTLTLTDAGSVWSSGALIGTGTLRLAAGSSLTLANAGDVTFSRADGNGFGGHLIENSGMIVWNGAGSLLGGDGAQIVNQAGGVFDLRSDALLGYSGNGNAPAFTNAGTFRKSAGTGTSTVSQTPFTTSGAVEVLSGTLSFTTGVTSNGGTFTSVAGASLLFTGGQSFNTGTSFEGGGTTRLNGGTTTVAGNISSENLTFAGGALQGSATVSGSLAWTGGAWRGTGTLTVAAGSSLVLSGLEAKVYDRADGNGFAGRRIENLGTLVFGGAGALLGGDGGQLINRGSGTVLIQNDAHFGYSGTGNQPVITNEGVFRKTIATGTTSILDSTFVNSGLVDVQTGTLAFSSGVTSNAGAFTASASSAITFGGGQTFNTGTSFTSPPGRIRITGGATTISGSLSASGLEFAGGDLYGSGTIGGTLSWTDGIWRTNGIVTFSAGSVLTLAGAADKTLLRGDGNGFGGRILQTGGTAIWEGAGRIVGGDGAGIDVLPAGLFEIRNDSVYLHNGSGNSPFLANAGTVRKLASSGTTTLTSVAFTNTGLLQVQGGTLSLTGGAGLSNQGMVEVLGGTLQSSATGMGSSGGTFSISNGAQLRYTGGTNTVASATYQGGGLTEVAGGVLAVSASTITGNFRLSSGIIGGSGTFTVASGGTFTWAGGTMNDIGTLAIASGGSLLIDGADPKTFLRSDGNGFGGRRIVNTGTTIWSGAGDLLGGDGAHFSNEAGGIFDARSDATFGYSGSGNGPTLNNAGTFKKSAGAGVTTLALPVTNPGVLESQSGTLRLSGGGTGAGQFLATGGVLEFASSYTLEHGARFVGSAVSKLTAGTLAVPAGATATVGGTGAGRFSFEGGALSGAGVFLVAQSGEAVWTAGSKLESIGVLRIGAGGTLQIAGAGNHDFYRGDGNGFGGRTIENFGTVNWSGGGIRGGDGAQFINAAGGVFEISSGGTFGHTGGGLGPTFANAGTLRKSAGAVTTFADTAFTHASTGIVEANGGSLVFASGVTSNGGTFFAGAGGSIEFSGGQSFGPGTQFAGPGTLRITAGNTTLAGSIGLTNLELAGGNLFGAATISSGVLVWTGGELRDHTTLTIAPGAILRLTGAGDRVWRRGDGNGFGGRVIENQGLVRVEHAGNLLGNDGAGIVNRPGGVLELRNDGAIAYGGSGNAPTVSNEGTLLKNAGTGTSAIAVPFTNSGQVVVTSGTLAFTSTFANTGGGFTLANGAALSVPVAFTVGTLGGAGTLTAPGITAATLLSPGASPGQLTIAGDLTLLASTTTHFEIGGTAQGAGYDFVNVSGSTLLAGTVHLTLVNGFQAMIQGADTFTVLTSASINGTFANAPVGGPPPRVFTSDGFGSFQVNYTATALTLSNFVAVPEPSTWALLGLGLATLRFAALRRRSRR